MIKNLSEIESRMNERNEYKKYESSNKTSIVTTGDDVVDTQKIKRI